MIVKKKDKTSNKNNYNKYKLLVASYQNNIKWRIAFLKVTRSLGVNLELVTYKLGGYTKPFCVHLFVKWS